MDIIKDFFVMLLFNNWSKKFTCCSQNSSKPISDIIEYNNNIQKEQKIKISKEKKERENYYHSINKSKFEKKNKKKVDLLELLLYWIKSN